MNGMLTRRMGKNISVNHYKSIFTFPVRTYYEKVGLPVDDEQFVLLSKEFIYHYELNKLNCHLFDGVEEVLQSVAAIGVSQSILSAYSQNNLNEIVEHFNLTKYFNGIKGLDNIYAGSKVEIGRQWIAELGLKKSEVILIGDTLHDKEVADKIGADCILIANGHQDKSVLQTTGVQILDSLSELKLLGSF
jgi:phosphoglycolate phosphatase